MRSPLSLGTRGSPMRWKKRAARPAQTTPRETRTRHTRYGEASGLRDDPACGEVVMRMLENVQQRTIKPLIQATITPGTCMYTDEYDIYSRLEQWGYAHA